MYCIIEGINLAFKRQISVKVVTSVKVGLEYWEVTVSLSCSRLLARPCWLSWMLSSSKLERPGDAPCAADCSAARWRVVAGLVVPDIVMFGSLV